MIFIKFFLMSLLISPVFLPTDSSFIDPVVSEVEESSGGVEESAEEEVA